MQLIILLLASVGILTFLSGAIVFFGSSKSDRLRSLWYFLASIFATMWMTAFAVFLAAKPGAEDYIHHYVAWAFNSALLLDVFFLGYEVWNKKYGKPLTMFFLVFGLAICLTLITNPSALIQDVTLNTFGNSVTMNIGPLCFAYIGFFCCIVPVIIASFLRDYIKSRSVRTRRSNLIMMIAFSISSGIVLVTDLILPLLGQWSIIWLGPVALGATIIMHYYIILRYQSLNLASMWLKILSYVVMVASLAVVYIAIFSIVFAALFRGSTPSAEVIILNFIMILVVIALIPAMSGLNKFIRNLISEQHPKPSKKQKDADKHHAK